MLKNLSGSSPGTLRNGTLKKLTSVQRARGVRNQGQVYITYSQVDGQYLAEDIKQYLKANHVPLPPDLDHDSGGNLGATASQMVSFINESQYVVILLTPKYMSELCQKHQLADEHNRVQSEVDVALECNCTLVVVFPISMWRGGAYPLHNKDQRYLKLEEIFGKEKAEKMINATCVQDAYVDSEYHQQFLDYLLALLTALPNRSPKRAQMKVEGEVDELQRFLAEVGFKEFYLRVKQAAQSRGKTLQCVADLAQLTEDILTGPLVQMTSGDVENLSLQAKHWQNALPHWARRIEQCLYRALSIVMDVTQPCYALDLSSLGSEPFMTCSAAEAVARMIQEYELMVQRTNQMVSSLQAAANRPSSPRDPGKSKSSFLWSEARRLTAMRKAGAAAQMDMVKHPIPKPIPVDRFCHINLEGCCIGPHGATQLADALQYSSTITSINLSNNSIGDLAADACALMILNSSTLKKVDLSCNKFTDTGGYLFFNTLMKKESKDAKQSDPSLMAVQRSNRLQHTLSRKPQAQKRASTQGGAPAKGSSTSINLQELDLSYNALGFSSASALASLFCSDSARCRIQSMRLAYNAFNQDALKLVCKALFSSPEVKTIDFCNNVVDEAVVKAMLCAVTATMNDDQSTMHGPHVLALNYTGMGDASAEKLGMVLGHTNALTELHLSHNNISAVGVKALAMALGRGADNVLLNLKVVDFSGNKFDVQAVEWLASAMMRLPALETLGLEGCGIGHAELSALLTGIKIRDDILSLLKEAVDTIFSNPNTSNGAMTMKRKQQSKTRARSKSPKPSRPTTSDAQPAAHSNPYRALQVSISASNLLDAINEVNNMHDVSPIHVKPTYRPYSAPSSPADKQRNLGHPQDFRELDAEPQDAAIDTAAVQTRRGVDQDSGSHTQSAQREQLVDRLQQELHAVVAIVRGSCCITNPDLLRRAILTAFPRKSIMALLAEHPLLYKLMSHAVNAVASGLHVSSMLHSPQTQHIMMDMSMDLTKSSRTSQRHFVKFHKYLEQLQDSTGGGSLRHLNLSNNPIQGAGGEVLARVLMFNTSLESLHVTDCLLSGATISRLHSEIQHYYLLINLPGNLRYLNLTRCDITVYREARGLAQILLHSPQLQHLVLDHNSFSTGAVMEALLPALKVCTQLHSLDLNFCCSDATSMNMAVLSLADVPSLTHAGLRGNFLDGGVGATLAKLLQKHEGLTSLELGGSYEYGLQQAGAAALATGIVASQSLRKLVLSKSGISSEQAVSCIAKTLAIQTRIQHLDLSHNRIGNDGAKQLLVALFEREPFSMYLNVCGNDIEHPFLEKIHSLTLTESAPPCANRSDWPLMSLVYRNNLFDTSKAGGVRSSTALTESRESLLSSQTLNIRMTDVPPGVTPFPTMYSTRQHKASSLAHVEWAAQAATIAPQPETLTVEPSYTRMLGATIAPNEPAAKSTLSRPQSPVNQSMTATRALSTMKSTRGMQDTLASLTFRPASNLPQCLYFTAPNVPDYDKCELKYNLQGVGSAVRCCAIAADNSAMAAVTENRVVWVWNLAHNTPPRYAYLAHDTVNQCYITPDCSMLLLVSHRVIAINLRTLKKLATIEGLHGDITGCSTTPDGRTTVVRHGKSITVFDWTIRSIRRTFEAHSTVAVLNSVSADGLLLVTAGEGGSIKMWRLDKLAMCWTATVHLTSNDALTACTCTPDCANVMTGTMSGQIIIFETNPSCFEPCGILRGHKGTILSIHVSQHVLLTAASDGTARLWHWQKSPSAIFVFKNSAPITTVGMPLEPEFAVTISSSETRIWDVETGECTLIMPSAWTGDIRAACVAQVNGFYVTGDDKGNVHVWDVDGEDTPDSSPGSSPRKLEYHAVLQRTVDVPDKTCVLSVALDPANRYLAAVTSRNNVCVWDLDTGNKPTMQTFSLDAIKQCMITPDGAKLLALSHRIAVMDLEAGEILQIIRPPYRAEEGVSGCIMASEGEELVMWHGPCVSVYNWAADGFRASFDAHSAAILQAKMSPDNSRLATVTPSGEIKIWDYRQVCEAVSQLHKSSSTLNRSTSALQRVSSMAQRGAPVTLSSTSFLPRSVAGLGDGVQLPGQLMEAACIQGGKTGSAVTSFAMSYNQVITGLSCGHVLFTNYTVLPPPSHWQVCLDAHTSPVLCMEVNRPATKLLTSSADGTARLWVLPAVRGQRSQPLLTLDPQDGPIPDVRFSPNEATVLTASSTQIKLWNAADGTPKATIPLSPSSVAGLQMTAWDTSTDSKILAATDQDDSIRVWNVSQLFQ